MYWVEGNLDEIEEWIENGRSSDRPLRYGEAITKIAYMKELPSDVIAWGPGGNSIHEPILIDDKYI